MRSEGVVLSRKRGVRSDPAPADTRGQWETIAALTALVLAVAHIVLTWNHVGKWWGDHGRWLHEVDRFAHGQTLYRDFDWPFPPLALWVAGGCARVFGSSINAISTVTAVIFLAICSAYWGISKRLVSGAALPLCVASGLLLAFAYADTSGPPLPLGMYTPAVPLGFLFLATALLVLLKARERATRTHAILLGLLTGSCILTKHDFWLPALYVPIALGLFLRERHHREWLQLTMWSVAVMALVVVIGVVVVSASAGPRTLFGILTGFDRATFYRGFGLPSWERLTLSVTQTGIVMTLVTSSLLLVTRRRVMAYWLVASAVVAALGAGLELAITNASIVQLRNWLEVRLFPFLLPCCVLAAVLLRRRWIQADRRLLVVVLLGLVITARGRRLFEGVEWFHFLLEIPVYVLVLQSITVERWRRGIVYLVAALTLIGAYEYRKHGTGMFTHRTGWETVETAKGIVRLPPDQARAFRWFQNQLAIADPSGKRPIFAFAYTGGLSYFLGRPNPAPTSEGLVLSKWKPEEIAARVMSSRPILIDNLAARHNPVPAPWISWKTWKQQQVENPHEKYGRKHFEKMLASCGLPIAHESEGRQRFTIYDCAAAGAYGTGSVHSAVRLRSAVSQGNK